MIAYIIDCFQNQKINVFSSLSHLLYASFGDNDDNQWVWIA